MLKTILDKRKREDLKEKVEVAFAAFTIISFAVSKIQQNRKTEETEEEGTSE